MTTKTEQFDESARGTTTEKQGLEPIQKAEAAGAPATLQFSESQETEIQDDSEDEDEEWEETLKRLPKKQNTNFKAGQVIYKVQVREVPGLGVLDRYIWKHTITKVTEKSYLTKRGRVSRCDYQYELYGSEEEAKDRWVALGKQTISDLQEKLRKGPKFSQD